MNSTIPNSIDSDSTIYHLTRSRLYAAYLRHKIIDETLVAWQQSLDGKVVFEGDLLLASNLAANAIDRRADLLKQYQRATWGHLIGSRFLQRKSQLDRVLFSAIQVTDLSLAQELYCRIDEQGQSFPHLATAYSQHPAAKHGGCATLMSVAELHPLVYHHLIPLKLKQLSAIFELNNCYTFLRLDRWLLVQLNLEMEEQLLDEIFEQWLQQQIESQIGNNY